jgi:hypothetical protein
VDGSGPERTSRLAARLPGVEIFAQGLVARRDGGWRITEAGRSALDVMERGARGSRAVAAQVVEPEPSPPCRSASLVDRRRIGDSEPSLVPAAFGTEPPLLAAHFPAEHCNDSVAHHDRYSNIRPVPGIVMSSRTDALVSQQEAGKIAASMFSVTAGCHPA